MPKRISIVTLSFNQKQYLQQAIESVLNQNYDNLEYIIVDPGNTDGSRETQIPTLTQILKIYIEKDWETFSRVYCGMNTI